MNRGRVLTVEDDEHLRRVTEYLLKKAGYQTAAASDATQALQILKATPVDLVITDMHMPGMSGIDLLRLIRAEYPETNVVVVTAYATVQTAVEAMKAGAYDYLTKPVHPHELLILVSRAMERRQMIEEIHQLRQTVSDKYGFENVIGHSPSVMKAVEEASRASLTDATVLIQGETGVGKEVFAKAIHLNSSRRERPFAVINCGSIPRDLLESELFGHVKGAFTGALAHKKGKVEAADGGTALLDEIGEMPLELQVRILRLIQEREIEKVGSTSPTQVDVRILAATHRDLPEMVAQGTFRQDLYYRLAVVPLFIPPLRERREDIPEFVVTFFRLCTEKHNRPDLKFPQDLLPAFTKYDWPGNVRQLQNVVERLVVLARTDEIRCEDLPDFLRAYCNAAAPPRAKLDQNATLDDVERELITRALIEENWNQTNAARRLGITRKALIGRIAKYGLRKPGRAEGA